MSSSRMQIVTLIAAHVIQQSHTLIAFGHALIIFSEICIWRRKSYSLSKVERAICILEILLEPVMHHHLVGSFTSVASSAVQNLLLVKR